MAASSREISVWRRVQLIVTYDTRTLCSSALRLGFEFRHFSPCFITRSRYFCPRGDTSAGRMDTWREKEREGESVNELYTRVLVYLYVFYNSRKQEWAVRNKTRVIIRGILHSTSRLFKSRNSKIRVRWMNVSSPKNSSSKVEFNLQLNPCFFVCSQRVEFVIRVVSY